MATPMARQAPPRDRCERSRRRARRAGTSFIEVMAALALLGLILTTSLAVVVRRQVFLKRIEDRLHVLNAVDEEIELLRSLPFSSLTPRHRVPLLGDGTELAGVAGAQAWLTLSTADVPRLVRARIEVTWGRQGDRSYTAETLIHGPRPLASGGP